MTRESLGGPIRAWDMPHAFVRLSKLGGEPWKDERLGTCGRQGQDSSRPATHSRREGGPNLGQPEAPLTALCSNVPSPSRLAGFRHSPCTCSLPENTGDQWRA